MLSYYSIDWQFVFGSATPLWSQLCSLMLLWSAARLVGVGWHKKASGLTTHFSSKNFSLLNRLARTCSVGSQGFERENWNPTSGVRKQTILFRGKNCKWRYMDTKIIIANFHKLLLLHHLSLLRSYL